MFYPSSMTATYRKDTQLYLNNYVLIETFTLLQNRFGLEAVRLFQGDILPVMEIAWIDEATHNSAVSALVGC